MSPRRMLNAGAQPRNAAPAAGRVLAYYLIGIAAAAALAWAASAFYPRMLPFDAKISRGYMGLAYSEAVSAAAGDDSEENIARLVRVLTLKGNLGRADLLAKYAGVEDEMLTLARGFQKSVQEEARDTGTIANHFADGKLTKLRGYPVYQDLKFYVGYKQALLGDWRAAKDYFAEANRAGVSPQLRPYLQYYYGRSLIVKGDKKERAQGFKMLSKLASGGDSYGLAARVSLNQLQAAIEAGQDSLFKTYLNKLRRESKSWEYAKAFVDLGEYFLERKEFAKAAENFMQALGEYPSQAATRKSAALGLAEAMRPLNGKLLELSGALTTNDGLSVLDEWVLALIELKQVKLAEPQLKLAAADESNAESRFLAMEALSLVYSETGNRSGLEALIVQASQLHRAPSWLLQSAYINYARLLRGAGETMPAISYYRKAQEINGGLTGEARYEEYELMKARFTTLDTARSIELLNEAVKLPMGRQRLRSGEELIALAELAGKRKLAEDSANAVSGESPDLGLFWRIYFARSKGDAKGEELLLSQIRVRRFSYYELQPLAHLSEADIDYLQRPFYLLPETPNEYLAGHFMEDLLPEDRAAVNEKDALAKVIALRNLELTSGVKTTSWAATELLEEGLPLDRALLGYVLNVAYPTPYLKEVDDSARRYGVPAQLIYAVMKKESVFDPNAVSAVGARGLMQLMPGTAEEFRRFLPTEIQGRSVSDPECAIHLGAAYLASLRTSFVEDHLVLSAYNGGPGNLSRWRRIVGTSDPILYVELIPNDENEQFVKKTLKYSRIYGMILSGE